MRSEENPLDLNNFPEDGEVIEDSSSAGKVYECRFCSLKFYKSQALGGHMNRHRQERETETLNRARQLVFNTDSLAAQAFHHLGGQPSPHGALYHQNTNMGDPNLYRSHYQPPLTSLFSGSSSTLSGSSSTPLPPPPQYQTFLYPSPPPPPQLVSYTSQYPPPPPAHDYFIGHVVSENNHYVPTPRPTDTNYTCVGAPIGHAFPTTSSGNRVPNMAASTNGVSDAFHAGF